MAASALNLDVNCLFDAAVLGHIHRFGFTAGRAGKGGQVVAGYVDSGCHASLGHCYVVIWNLSQKQD